MTLLEWAGPSHASVVSCDGQLHWSRMGSLTCWGAASASLTCILFPSMLAQACSRGRVGFLERQQTAMVLLLLFSTRQSKTGNSWETKRKRFKRTETPPLAGRSYPSIQEKHVEWKEQRSRGRTIRQRVFEGLLTLTSSVLKTWILANKLPVSCLK